MRTIICAAIGLFCIAATPLSKITVPDSYDNCDDCSVIVREMAWSLDNEPTLWTTDGFRLCRSGGGCIWIANQAYGIGIGPTERTVELQSHVERNLLWRAAQRWLVRPENYR